MNIEIIGDGISKEDALDKPLRVACRGIVRKGDKFLMVHLQEWDIYTFPGGGLEDNETLEDCVKREVFEETGVKVKVVEEKTIINEYFSDSRWENHYFTCDLIEETDDSAFTQEEIDLRMRKLWMTFDEIMDQFENNMTNHVNGPAVHNRELLGLINSL